MEGATRSRGHRPYSAARPPRARSAIDPSTCQRAVCGTVPGGGSLIPPARAIGALMIPVIEAAFRTGPMAAAGGPDRPAAGRRATRRRAIRVAAIARGADREEAAAPPTRFLAKRRVHNVGAATHSNWIRTSHSWHKERRLTRSVGASRRSPRVWRLKLQTLTSSATSVSLRGRTPKPKRPWTPTPTAIKFCDQDTGTERRREQSRFLRFYVVSNSTVGARDIQESPAEPPGYVP